MSRTLNSISDIAVQALSKREAEAFLEANPKSAALAARARECLYDGVPMHWMSDWSTPCPLFVARANGASFIDIDGHDYADFCFGDTGAMFGHSPKPVADAIAAHANDGFTAMLPGEDAVWVGNELARRFGLPFWQMATTASDANRAVIRWARAVTKRPVILVFDGCYHGMVDECHVRLKDGKTAPRPGLVGQVHDFGATTRVIEFNDLDALQAALKPGDVAAVLCEPAMTNIGMVLPDPGFHAVLRALTRSHGTLLIIDETHTISTGPGGYTRAFDLEPDFFVLGKPIAGGIPCSVYGFTAAVAEKMDEARKHASSSEGHGHSGMGTTLSANMFVTRAMRANLEHVMTQQAYDYMVPLADHLARQIRAVFAKHAVPWCVTQIGARVEFQFCPFPPRTGAMAERAFNVALEQGIHLYLLNRGVMITPFHNMMLVCPQTDRAGVERLVSALDRYLEEVRN